MQTPSADDWDASAETFDAEPDHGLSNPAVRSAWARLLLPSLPPAPATVADIGCGTGTLSVLLASADYDVRGVDLSAPMLAVAARKAAAAGVGVPLVRADAADPPYAPASFDAVLVRHLLWALPDRDGALMRWARLLRPDGVLVLIEGRWSTGAGVTAELCEQLVGAHFRAMTVQRLDDRHLWGREIDDERFLIRATARRGVS